MVPRWLSSEVLTILIDVDSLQEADAVACQGLAQMDWLLVWATVSVMLRLKGQS